MIREFTEQDWVAFTGAEEWNSADQPLIREAENWVGVCCPTGIDVVLSSDTHYSWRAAIPTQAMGRLFLSALPESLDVEQAEKLGLQ